LPSICEALNSNQYPDKGVVPYGECLSSLSLSQPSRRAPKERPEMLGISDGNLKEGFRDAAKQARIEERRTSNYPS